MGNRGKLTASVVACLAGALALPASAQGIDRAAAFGELPKLWSVRVAPDGKQVAYVAEAKSGGRFLAVLDRANGKVTPALSAPAGELRLERCNWQSNVRLLCTFYGISNQNQAGFLLPFSRLVGVDADGRNVKELQIRQAGAELSLYQDSVIDWLANDDDHVLVQVDFTREFSTGTRLASTAEGVGVIKLNTRTGTSSVHTKPDPTVASWYSDGDGNILAKLTVKQDTRTGYLRDEAGTYVRAAGGQWHKIARSTILDIDMVPLGFDQTAARVYLLGEHNGRDALMTVDLANPAAAPAIAYAREDVDVDGVETGGRFRRVIGAAYTLDAGQIEYFDEKRKKLSSSIARSLPGSPLVTIVSESDDGQTMVVHTHGDDDAGRYYLLDRTKGTMDELGIERPQVDKMSLARVKPVSYPASDGTMIPAYLTTPAGLKPGPAPVVLLPHGGPGSRDSWGFDWLAQYFASLGYVVMQMNFRGSSGYGEAWFRENGFKSWPVAVGDINDAARWLIKQGIADPDRVAIAGWSYGGYASLMAAVTEPSVYKAVIAIAPVTDLVMLKSEALRTAGYTLTRDYIGEGPHVAQGSPARRAGEIRAPVMLVHGTHDLNVRIAHSTVMADALRSAGKTVQFVSYDKLDHQLDSGPARTDMLRKAAALLETAVPTD